MKCSICSVTGAVGGNFKHTHIQKIWQRYLIRTRQQTIWYYIPSEHYLNFQECIRAPLWSSSSVLDHRSLPPVFESQRGHIWRLLCLSLRLITFGSRSAHLAYLMHKSGRKTSIIIINPGVYTLCRFLSGWLFCLEGGDLECDKLVLLTVSWNLLSTKCCSL